MKWKQIAGGLVVTMTLAGCFGKQVYQWSEEVLLHDGRIIVIQRSMKSGYLPREIGQPPPESDYTLTFDGVDGEKVIWDGGRGMFVPMILDVYGGVPFVVATGGQLISWREEGCPRPPYFFFKWTGNQWRRVTYDQFPKSIRSANLSVGLTYPSRDPMHERISRGEIVTKEDVMRLNRTADPDAKEIREDKPNPCATWADDFRYTPRK